MSKKAMNESISDTLKFIIKKVKTLQNNGNTKDNESLNEILENIKELQNFFKGIRKLFLILVTFILLLIVLLGISISYNNKLIDNINELENKKVDSILQTIMDIKVIKKNDSTTVRSYNYQVKGNEIITYNDLLKENDSLTETYQSLKLKNQTLKNKLKLVETNYNVTFNEFYKIKNKDSIKYIRINGKNLDSALILLEHYRKNLFYDKNRKEWRIFENR